ncbi:HlyD family efflux transporter periplasmic adaptor subunit [Bacteroides fragilis]|nr:HlyD family efflux transporter periplasmic adaptor subunit [Bacteroides fragilis]MCE8693463.1 HlyD family efflux transporter periplasmic adaptor subunit [Bacteroides fragilis]MCE9317877.1 HlyD family efflux transporter periplasmic adaptor subunit [Bacteroides fragilis]MCE9331095.1 HlyD family efflux transporter periplasmic adaptor subunit [Bacteroides fragilis]
MEKEHTHKEIELRSEEVQEVMNRVPAWILRSGITVLFIIVVVLVAGSYWFKYPDVITAEVTVSTQEPPSYVMARSAGRLADLYVQNGQEVKPDMNLGVIENTARAVDVFSLKGKMQKWKQEGYTPESGKNLFLLSETDRWRLGEIQSAYAGFVSTLSEVVRMKELGYYAKKLQSQKELLATQKKYYDQVRRQYFLIEKEYALAHASYARDSILYHRKAMIITEFEQSGSRYLQSLQSKESARMQLTQVDMQIEQSEETLLDLEKQAFEEQQTQEVNLRNATDQLLGQLAAWEQHYLLRSPVGGKVTFLNVWSVNQYVESGATVFVVAPKEESLPVGTALLPLQGSGKVKAGQRVNLRLNNYPDQEFGYVRGEVRSVSPLPTAEGMYVVDIALPDGLTTNYGKMLPLTREMKGSAEIITDDLRLLERLIMPLQKIFMEQK